MRTFSVPDMLPSDLEPGCSEPANAAAATLPARIRWLLVLTAAGLAMSLAIAGAVEPDPRGYGTHEHLGLRPCTFRVLFNRPCPSCGMTTAWAYAMHGHWLFAFRANAGGALLALAAMLAAVWFLGSAVLGRWLFRPPSPKWIGLGASAVGLITLAQWLVRLFCFIG